MHAAAALTVLLSAGVTVVSALPQSSSSNHNLVRRADQPLSISYVCNCKPNQSQARENETYKKTKAACEQLRNGPAFITTTFKYNFVDNQCDVYNAPKVLLSGAVVLQRMFNTACGTPNTNTVCISDPYKNVSPGKVYRNQYGKYVINSDENLYSGTINGVKIVNGVPFTGTLNGTRYKDGLIVKKSAATRKVISFD